MLTRRFSGYFQQVSFNRLSCFKLLIFVLTYVAYTSYHMSRKPLSVVKSVLGPEHIVNGTHIHAWPPFDGAQGQALLGLLDTAFLIAYAIGMFFSGMLAERFNLRYYLALGMLSSGLCCVFFGIAHTYKIHSFLYFACIQVVFGLLQTTGWPALMAVMGNWFGSSKNGLVFGIWNTHTSLGNCLGSLIAGAYVEYDWALSFIYPGLIIGLVGFLLWLFLVPDPADVNLAPVRISRSFSGSSSSGTGEDSDNDASLPLISKPASISFGQALKIPGVIEYSLCLFFAKLVSYTFLFWLPKYINSSTALDPKTSAYVSILFDVGGAIGGILAGVLRDVTNLPAVTCSFMLITSIPLMYLYESIGVTNMTYNFLTLFFVGFFINGPYALITTTISTDLAMRRQHRRNRNLDITSEKSLATVSAIIDGTGSIGATIGPFLTGFLTYNWTYVFWMMIISNMFSVLFLIRILKREIVQSLTR